MSMDEQARIEGSELDALLDIMKVISEQRDRTGYLRVCVDDGALKIKIDEGVWSPPIGYRDARSMCMCGRPIGHATNTGPYCGPAEVSLRG